MNPDFTVILSGYRRIAVAAGLVVIAIVAARGLVFFGLASPAFIDLLPAASLLTGALLLAILAYGYRWLSRRLGRIQQQVQEAQAQNNRDALTGVFTRAYFLEALGAHVFHGSQTPVGYLQLDMDNLKILNDSAGHAAGDAALVHLCRIIEQVVPGGVVGRLGGDEFGIMVAGHDNKAALRRLGEALLRALERPVNVAGRAVRLSASVGVALSPQDAVDRPTWSQKPTWRSTRPRRAGATRW
jgi:diguanylate cyclase (GGDEF)-like protein